MRSAIVTLIATVGIAASAVAQTATPASPASPPTSPAVVPPPAPPVAAPAPMPASSLPSAAAAPGVASPSAPPAAAPAPLPLSTTPAPMPSAAAPPTDVAIPEVAPTVPEKTYTVPTDGEIGQIINTINSICVPLVRGGDLDKLATPAMGYKKNRREGTYTTTLVAKPYTLTVYAPGSNKDVCRIAINYTTGEEKPIIVGLNIFSLLHQPELLQQRNDYKPDPDYKRITNSWEYFTEKESTGLVFLQLKKPDGSEVSPKWSIGEVLYSERKF